jgi:protoporphyrinogen IX oxidase
MAFEYIKALHIIFIVTWFAGLFYIVRLFIYQTEALAKPETERNILVPYLNIMASRLWYIITWPSAVLTLIFGIWIMTYRWGYLQMGFMQAKLAFVVGLYVYQIICHKIFADLQKGKAKWTSVQLRMWNEVATVLLFAVVFLIVLKSLVDMVWGIAGLIFLSLLMMLGIKWYKKIRERKT